ncbi:MAG: ankyrin repeat domain-containing protein [Lentisphaeria bacterium]|nr:ankyrin repeat domain-containing protein [Lentisphaeria bacterium]
MLEHGVNPNIQNTQGFTPLHAAARRTASPKTLALLIDAGGDPSLQTIDGKTPLDLALEKKKVKNVAFLEKL